MAKIILDATVQDTFDAEAFKSLLLFCAKTYATPLTDVEQVRKDTLTDVERVRKDALIALSIIALYLSNWDRGKLSDAIDVAEATDDSDSDSTDGAIYNALIPQLGNAVINGYKAGLGCAKITSKYRDDFPNQLSGGTRIVKGADANQIVSNFLPQGIFKGTVADPSNSSEYTRNLGEENITVYYDLFKDYLASFAVPNARDMLNNLGIILEIEGEEPEVSNTTAEEIKPQTNTNESIPNEEIVLDSFMSGRCAETINALDLFYKTLLDSSFVGVLASKDGVVSAYSCVNAYNKPEALDDNSLNTGLQLLASNTGVLDCALPLADIDVLYDADVLITAWRNAGSSRSYYLPQIHVNVLSGMLSTGKRSLKYPEHKGSVSQYVTALFKALQKQTNSQAEGKALEEAILNLVVIQKFDYSTLLTVATTFNVSRFEEVLKNSDVILNTYAQPLAKELSIPLIAKTNSAPGLSIINYCFDIRNYRKDINFAYKAVLDMADRGQKSDFGNVLLGTADDGSKVAINLMQPNVFCVPIFAGSGSGKGVMTLAILGTAIATGHPFVYLDNKPDMAAMLWGIEAELNRQGANARFLAIDTAIVTDPGALKTAKYIPERIQRCLNIKKGDNGTISDVTLKGTKAILDLLDRYDVRLTDKKTLSTFYACSIVCKMSKLILMLDEKDLAKGNRLIAVIDECNSISGYFTTTTKNGSGFVGSALRNAITKCKEIKKAKLKEGDTEGKARQEQAAADLAVLLQIAKSLNGTPPEGGNGEVIQYPSSSKDLNIAPISSSVLSYLNTSGRQNNALLTMCIGQTIDTMSYAFPWTPALYHDSSTKILGRGNLSKAEADKLGYDEEGKTPVGTFLVADDNKCKSYLTLNENDYYSEPKYYNTPAKTFTGGPATDKSDAWIRKNYGTSEQPNTAVGFWGYVQLLAKTNNISLDTVISTMSEGYERALKVLTDKGIIQKGGYSCIEEWLYDISPESYCFDTVINIDTEDDEASGGIDLEELTRSATAQPQSTTNTGNQPQPNANTGNQPQNTGTAQPQQAETNQPVDNTQPQQAYTGNGQPNPNFAQQYAMQNPPYAYNQPVPPEPEVSEINNPGVGTQTATSANMYGAYYKASMGIINAMTPTNSPFAVFRKNNPKQNYLLRKNFTEILMAKIKEDFGGYDGIYTFSEVDGCLVINDVKFMPTIPDDIVSLAPEMMKKELAHRHYATVFDYKQLFKFKNLTEISFDNAKRVDAVFWTDTCIARNDMDKIRKRWRKLLHFYVAKDDLFEKDQAKVAERQKKEQERDFRCDTSKFCANFASALGLEPADSDKVNHYWGQITRSAPARAIRTGIGFAGAMTAFNFALGLANPILLVAGLVTAGSWVANKHKDNKQK